MKKMIQFSTLIAGIAFMALSCTQQFAPAPDMIQPSGTPLSVCWDFDSDEGWLYSSTSRELEKKLENGSIFLFSFADKKDASNIQSCRNDFLSGKYEWRLYIPVIQADEQVAIKCGLKSAEGRQLDFCIAYGPQQTRSDFELSSDELLLCVGSSANPFSASYCAIAPGWHNFELILEQNTDGYRSFWMVDGEQKYSISLDYGPNHTEFALFSFLGYEQSAGSLIPSKAYQLRIDYVKADAYVSGNYKEGSDNSELSFSISGDVPLADGTEISLFSQGGNYRFVSSNSKISGIAPVDDSYWALYPYDPQASISKTGIATILPADITAYESVGDVHGPSFAVTENDSFCFSAMTSILQFRLEESLANVSEIIISDPSGSSLEGNTTIDCDNSTLYIKALSDACIHLKTSNGSAFKPGVPYYACIPAGRYSSGLDLTLLEADKQVGSVSLPSIELKAGECSKLQDLSIEEKWAETRWDFDNNINGWYYYTHNPASGECYSFENGCVKLWTNANSMDRNKLHTIRKDFGEGIYTFRTYVTRIAPGEKCSIGAFIYADDSHEMDFEIGYGKESARTGCGAAEDEMVACMTSQDLPFNSTYTPISVGWHTLVLKLNVIDGKYRMTWIIDDIQIKQLNLRYGPEIKFLISVSVENLEFMGDFQPQHENYALFDYVSYKQQQ